MTKTKLEIIGPYTPEHEGPFCTRNGRPVRIICVDRKGHGVGPIVALVDNGIAELAYGYDVDGTQGPCAPHSDLMNAREVPVAREFWVNEYDWGLGDINETLDRAKRRLAHGEFIRTIHVREVLPGDGE